MLPSKELATIHCAVPMEIDFEQAKFENPKFDVLKDLFIELEFKTLYNRLLKVYDNSTEETIDDSSSIKTDSFDKSKTKYKLINNLRDAKQLADRLKKEELFVFDTETDGSGFIPVENSRCFILNKSRRRFLRCS